MITTRTAHRFGLRVVAIVALLVLAACGTDDGSEVRNLGDSTGTATGSASGSGSATGSGSASGPAECAPVGRSLAGDADTRVVIEARDYLFDPSSITVGAGVITFEVTNTGDEPHELAFLPGDGEVPFTDAGDPDEDALAAMGAFELEAFGPGTTCDATYDLDPGVYTLFCIVETDAGVTHLELGMRGTLTVE